MAVPSSSLQWAAPSGREGGGRWGREGGGSSVAALTQRPNAHLCLVWFRLPNMGQAHLKTSLTCTSAYVWFPLPNMGQAHPDTSLTCTSAYSSSVVLTAYYGPCSPICSA